MLADEFCTAIVGARVSDIRRLDFTWFFSFDSGWTVATECYWRALTADRIAVSQSDDGQAFGHPKPIDAKAVARKTLTAPASRCDIDPVCGDLLIGFTDGCTLQLFNESAGYEGWRASHGQERTLVAMGGGKVVAV